MASDAKLPILVVEDEAAIRSGLLDVLAFHGYAPEGVERGDSGLRTALRNQHALVLLDVMLPGMNGVDVCRALREKLPRLPILMLTARGAESDVIDGFAAGADDYVTKPFSVAELMARVDALLRRAGARPAGADGAAFEVGGWKVDAEALRARRVDGDEAYPDDGGAIELTRREVELLALFAREPGRILSRRRLLQELWGFPDPDRVETRTVDMHVAKLRRKLGAAGDALIETVRGQGYRLVP